MFSFNFHSRPWRRKQSKLANILREQRGRRRSPIPRVVEMLEDRRLAAIDVFANEPIDRGDSQPSMAFVIADGATSLHASLRHNAIDPEDVNDDGECTPADALIVINGLNAEVEGESASASTRFVDVNNDGARTSNGS